MRAFPRSSNDVSAVVGVLLLVVPTYFVTMSALRYDAPGLKFFGSPILILGTLAIAFAINARSIASVKLQPEKPPVLKIALSLPDMDPCGNHACVTSLGCVVHICVRGEFRATPNQISDVCRKGTGLITEDGSETRLVIGHENSLLHKEIYWGVDSAPSLTKNVQ